MIELFYNLMEQSTFMALFIVLLVYTTRKNDTRELKYIQIIELLIQDKEGITHE